jgi:UDPglucose 6-dehydrogenase
VPCSIVDAELTKVAYNTYISLKIVWANHLGAICDAVGADADTVVGALAMADERVISSAYLTPGMGDGGACHPRDLIALADLERRHELPGFFYGLAALRDEQTLALARTVVRWCEQTGLEPMVLGLGYKKDTPLTDGSPSLLLVSCIQQLLPDAVVESYDPLSSPASVWPDYTQPRVYALAAKHSEFTETGIEFGPGSVVIDPWGVLPERCPGVVYVRPGRR